MKTSLFSILAGGAMLPLSFATDLRFGADTLPYVAEKADLVAEAASITNLESPSDRVSVYQLRISKALKGEMPAMKTITVMVPKGVDVLEAEGRENKVVFLRGPIPEERKQNFGIVAQEPVYEIVSGRYGLVSAETPIVAAEVTAYLKSPVPDRIDWASRNVESSSIFLQRSAIAEVRSHREDPAALAMLDKALDSKKVATAVKLDAIAAIQATDTPQAVTSLKEAAQDRSSPELVRRTAVEALQGLDGGMQILREFKAGTDSILATEAKQVIEQASIQQSASGSGAISPSVSPSVLKKAPMAEKLSYVQSLSQANTAEAIAALKDAALDVKQDRLVRSNAILGISQAEAGLSQPVLKDLGNRLTEPDLKQMAATLAK